jgi:hypothetical protein
METSKRSSSKTGWRRESNECRHRVCRAGGTEPAGALAPKRRGFAPCGAPSADAEQWTFEVLDVRSALVMPPSTASQANRIRSRVVKPNRHGVHDYVDEPLKRCAGVPPAPAVVRSRRGFKMRAICTGRSPRSTSQLRGLRERTGKPSWASPIRP